MRRTERHVRALHPAFQTRLAGVAFLEATVRLKNMLRHFRLPQGVLGWERAFGQVKNVCRGIISLCIVSLFSNLVAAEEQEGDVEAKVWSVSPSVSLLQDRAATTAVLAWILPFIYTHVSVSARGWCSFLLVLRCLLLMFKATIS